MHEIQLKTFCQILFSLYFTVIFFCLVPANYKEDGIHNFGVLLLLYKNQHALYNSYAIILFNKNAIFGLFFQSL